MLRQRIITALIIAPIALACVFLLPPFEFSLFVAAVLIVCGWEWGNLAGLTSFFRFVYATFVGISIFGVSFLPADWVLAGSLIWWLAALVMVVMYPKLDRAWGSKVVVMFIGFLALVPGWVALSQLKLLEHSSYFICLLLFLIWGADIGAYFTGKKLGRHKLAPRVSPGKTWEGFFGGLIVVLVIAALMSTWFGRPQLGSVGGVILLVTTIGIGMVSVLGDLTISMFKRHRDIKDSSNLLPGHGGFLDRIDSLLSASPVFALYLLSVDWI
ncbi:MAG: phosphatidate cytidylyltransferase [Gammaproteobacteria bacterium]|nr:phosphatidate cytidylyltransferase [Gammaproteobacteria bacterium]MBT7371572.1 phosphatidate cytidylyltransferase [Gammaproteobacteria bacterium]